MSQKSVGYHTSRRDSQGAGCPLSRLGEVRGTYRKGSPRSLALSYKESAARAA